NLLIGKCQFLHMRNDDLLQDATIAKMILPLTIPARQRMKYDWAGLPLFKSGKPIFMIFMALGAKIHEIRKIKSISSLKVLYAESPNN
ncbi:hypothetical protein, partial [Neobacillus drentensis]|uniref:hypothetical protein n=1 Tax=Neobacillus drentensis TaxID=220684 RepID=UPI003002F4E7